MLASRAIINTRVDAIAEIIEDGVDGLLINPGSTEELIAAIRYLATQPELRQKLGASARTKVTQQLTPSIEYQNWMNVYQRVLGISDAGLLGEIYLV